jgi:hypothetical protein
VHTARGDTIMLTLFINPGEDPSILVSVFDADESPIPTAEFTLPEAGELRDELRRLCERGSKHGVVPR